MKIIKSHLLLISLIIISYSCKKSCESFPVKGAYRGGYKVNIEDTTYHFIGVDQSFNDVDITIPKEFYEIEFLKDGGFKVTSDCRYGE